MNEMLENKPLTSFLLVLVAGGLLASGYFYTQAKRVSGVSETPKVSTELEMERLLASVGKLMVLPEGEAPTIATVSDAEALKSQPFFAKAQIGDKVLIYEQAKKAILYSVSQNKIIEVAPLNIQVQEPSQPASVPEPQPAPSETTEAVVEPQ